MTSQTDAAVHCQRRFYYSDCMAEMSGQ